MSIGGLLNDSFGLGLHARALANSVEAGPVVGPVDQMDFWYGGLFLEYVLGAENLVYLSGDLTLAYGELSSAMRDTDFYVAEPAINLNINITETLMFGIGASYRSVSGTDAVGLEDSDLSEMAWNISLRFTQF